MTKSFNPQSFAVIGAGPVGCIVSAYLARSGAEVTLCDIVPRLTEPAIDPGLIIEGAENLTQKVSHTCTEVDEIGAYHPDVIFVTVKANVLPQIAPAIAAFIEENTVVISWQNGIDTELELKKVLGEKKVMRAVVNFGCGLKSPGHVHMSFHHPPHFIKALDKSETHKAESIASLLTQCGLKTIPTQNIIPMIWQKAVMNACMNPVCATTGLTMAQAMADPTVFNIINALIKECLSVARANEIFLGWDFHQSALEYMGNAGHHKPSMLMDIENRKKTEVDYINGKFVEYGRFSDVKTPYNETLLSLVKGLESHFDASMKASQP